MHGGWEEHECILHAHVYLVNLRSTVLLKWRGPLARQSQTSRVGVSRPSSHSRQRGETSAPMQYNAMRSKCQSSWPAGDASFIQSHKCFSVQGSTRDIPNVKHCRCFSFSSLGRKIGSTLEPRDCCSLCMAHGIGFWDAVVVDGFTCERNVPWCDWIATLSPTRIISHCGAMTMMIMVLSTKIAKRVFEKGRCVIRDPGHYRFVRPCWEIHQKVSQAVLLGGMHMVENGL
jgi:hypothetical protein